MYNIGIDLGGTNISIGMVDEKFNIINKRKIKTNVPRKESEICDDISDLVLELLKETGNTIENINSIGMGSPGSVNKKEGIVEYSTNLYFHNWYAKKMMEQRLKKEIYIENDANAAAYGEYLCGAAKGAKSAVTVTIGTGIGSGIIIDGKIYNGFNYNGAELGHMVIYKDGRNCNCGRKGCFEKYASATGLIYTTKQNLINYKKDTIIWDLIDNNLENISARTAFRAKRMGDELGATIIDRYIADLSCGLTNIINIFQPEILCLGGGVCNEGEELIRSISEYIEKERYSKNAKKQTQMCIAKLGNDAGIIGAAFLNKTEQT